jgi:serine/threonine-protein kinase HipA
MNICPGCFTEEQSTYCAKCRRLLFDGKKVASALPFTRPSYNQARLKITEERMSISGIQTKISLILKGCQLEMAESGGQYILKPIPNGDFELLDLLPINEHLTMQMARQIFEIEVAENALVSFADDELSYITRRFDVQPDGSRALQEDFAQVATMSEDTHGRNYKYDYSYEEMGYLIKRYVAASRVDLERFFKLVVFNYLVNNGDAHLKNFSLIRMDETGEYRLSPAYDLLNTRLHLPTESITALTLFKEDFETESFKVNAYYAYDDFVELAQRLGIVEVRYQRILKSFIDKYETMCSFIDRSVLTDDAKQKYKKYVKGSIKALGYSFSGQADRNNIPRTPTSPTR